MFEDQYVLHSFLMILFFLFINLGKTQDGVQEKVDPKKLKVEVEELVCRIVEHTDSPSNHAEQNQTTDCVDLLSPPSFLGVDITFTFSRGIRGKKEKT